jgi:Tfp pilus assembly protein PilO
MKGTDKVVVLAVAIAVVLGAFYFGVLSPKREKASQLSAEITDLNASISQQQQTAQFAEDARHHFPTYYGRLVVLGKAVPADADTASLLVQVDTVANRSGVKFAGLTLSAGSGETSAASTPPPATDATSTGTTSTPTTTTPSSSGSSSTATTTSATTTPTPATEAGAASLPIGATVGAAGLPTMPYDLTFTGTYFQVAGFLSGIDSLVHMRNESGQVAADGRLLTVDGFALTPLAAGASPQLSVNLAVTSFVTPSDQGLTAGASPTGPPLTQPTTQPTSATVSP